MVRADKPCCITTTFNHRHRAMQADSRHSTEFFVSGASYDDGLVGQIEADIVSDVRQLIRARHANPVVSKNGLLLGFKYFCTCVCRGWQRPAPLKRGARAGNIICIEQRDHLISILFQFLTHF